MCGIAGFLALPDSLDDETALRRAMNMGDAIAWRGPDASGQWADTSAGIAFGHRRLAIVDLSEAGLQPMHSASGRYVICYNGEIYNHGDIRRELEQSGRSPVWRGHSDTETLIAGFEAWGIEATIVRAIGMFAVAVWDRETRSLTLVRDRLGEKPLYYGWQGSGTTRTFLFGSDLNALRAHPAFEAAIDRGALIQMLRHGHVGETHSIHEGVCKLRPGHIVTITQDSRAASPRAYWDGGAIAAAEPARSDRNPETVVNALETLLLDATGRQMMSDVPLGAFLSGGIDSSTIVALMQHLSDRPVHTFSIGFHEKRYNEAEFAKAIAAYLGTHHTELYVGEPELLDVVPKLAHIYDEPFADSSQIPTFLVAQLARQHVTVALSGDGGDELFCGYDRYRQGEWFMANLRRLPHRVRAIGAGAVHALPRAFLNRVIEPFVPTPEGKERAGQRLHRIAEYGESVSPEDLHRKLVSRTRMPGNLVIGGEEPPGLLDLDLPPRGTLGTAGRMMQLDMLTYLPDDILTKVDRASMAVSLECRAPMLDHRVVEFAWSLPQEMKVRDGQSKWALRQVLYRHVPQSLIDRPKMGFEVPIGLWLRGPLRSWADALLAKERLTREGFLQPVPVRALWDEHQAGTSNWGMVLWNILMFQAWLERHGPSA
jgi:asparagine synthase (glutamine-hydrolysing)